MKITYTKTFKVMKFKEILLPIELEYFVSSSSSVPVIPLGP